MDADDALPTRRANAMAQAAAEDLDPWSVEELEARLAALAVEIARTRAKLDQAINHRASADALFRRQ